MGSELAGKLLRAAKAGDARGVLAALAQGAHIESRDAVGITALMAAARSGSAGASLATRALLESGAQVGAAAPSGDTALHWAACGDDDESCRILIEHGARVGALNDESECALEVAARMGSGSAARLLWDGSSAEARARALAWAQKMNHHMAAWMSAMQEARLLEAEVAEGSEGSSARRL